MQIQTYHELTQNEPPSQFLLKTLDNPDIKIGKVLELGCGSGRDTIELLRRGWLVTAVDCSVEGIGFLKEKAKEIENVDIRNTSFESMQLDRDFYDLIYSRYSLSFCQKSNWSQVWEQIFDSLKQGGVISIHLFGVNDGFKDSKLHGEMTFFNNLQVDELFRDFDVIFKHEEERDAKSKVGQMKHWHVFTIVAKKK